jgi:hypothetical protein
MEVLVKIRTSYLTMDKQISNKDTQSALVIHNPIKSSVKHNKLTVELSMS